MTAEWHYTEGGRQKGPITEGELKRMVAEKALAPDVQVWRKGMQSWQAFRNTDLGAETDLPPPVAPASINNSIVWLIALSPLVIEVLDQIVQQIQFQNALKDGTFNIFGTYQGIPIQVTAGALAMLGWFDQRRLRRAGYGSSLMTGFAILLTPIYLFMRAHKLGQTPYYGFVWFICMIIALAM